MRVLALLLVGCTGFSRSADDLASAPDALTESDLASVIDLAGDMAIDCGRLAEQRDKFVEDGSTVAECSGCACTSSWRLFGCYSETQSYGEPWGDFVWQRGAEVLRFAVTPTARLFVTGKAFDDTVDSASATVNAMTITPGGAVDVELSVRWTHVDMYQQSYARILDARVIATCQ